MTKENILKLLIFNALLSIINIIVFSNAFLHIDITEKNPLTAALGVMVIVMSIVLFFYGNHRILFKKPEQIKVADVNTLSECEMAIKGTLHIETFSKELKLVLGQITRLRKKKNTINDILLQKFTDTEISYICFQETVNEIEKVMCLNIKSVINRLGAFDEDEYIKIKHLESLPNGIMQSKLDIYNEYISFVEKSVERNEDILFKLDRLLAEISKYNSVSDEELESCEAMKEIEELINNAKWYK